MPPSKLIQLQTVTKSYRDGSGEVLALKGLSVDFATNSKTAIMGPSGSGKSTMLQLIGGLDTPTSGTVTVAGQAVGEMKDRELSTYRNRYIGFIFQTFNLQSYLTAVENVALPLILSGEKAATAEATAMRYLDQVGMADKSNRYQAQLSGGEMQRVAIARALAHAPKVVLADEPTANLDQENADKVLELMSSLNLDGQALIIVTHDDRVAARFERTVHIQHGKLMASRPSSPALPPAAAPSQAGDQTPESLQAPMPPATAAQLRSGLTKGEQ